MRGSLNAAFFIDELQVQYLQPNHCYAEKDKGSGCRLFMLRSAAKDKCRAYGSENGGKGSKGNNSGSCPVNFAGQAPLHRNPMQMTEFIICNYGD